MVSGRLVSGIFAMGSSRTTVAPPSDRVRLIVASSVMLTFISFWRAAAIVLNDLGSSAFYAGGIAEQAVGAAAPWFILGIMLFSFAVRAVYVESCSMFTRGGVYRVVKEAMGGLLAKLSVSALMFDYILTGPISGVSAGQYVIGLLLEVAEQQFGIKIGTDTADAMKSWGSVVIACLSAMFQMAVITAFPLWSIMMITLDVIIIYQLTARWERV